MAKKTMLRLAPLALAAALIVPATIARAEGTQKAKNPYGQEIKAITQTIKSNRDANKALKDAIKQKKQEAKSLTKGLKETGALKDKKDGIKAQQEAIKAEQQKLKAINEGIKAKKAEVKEDRQAKNYEELLKDLKTVPDMQTGKTPILQNISNQLDALIGLLK